MGVLDRLEELCKEKGIMKSHICSIVGRKPFFFKDVQNGKQSVPPEYYGVWAKALGTTPEYLRGETNEKPLSRDAIKRLKKTVPVLGVIKAGIPILAEENYEGEIESDIDEDFALRISGDSMIYAGILDGDHVLLSETDRANSGDIVAATEDDGSGLLSATLKFYVTDRQSGPVLRPANPSYQDQPFTKHHRIIGVFAGLVRYAEPRISEARGLMVQSEQLAVEWLRLVDKATSTGVSAADVESILAMLEKVKK